MSKNAGIVLEIIDGFYKGHFAIAYHAKQDQKFKDLNKFVVTIFDDENFTSIHKDNALIDAGKVKHVCFCD